MIPLFVTGYGAVTALGLDARRTVASLRGGLDGLTELPFAGKSSQDLRAVPVQGYAEGMMGPARFEALATKALSECLIALREQEPERPAVFLGLPLVGRPGVDSRLESLVKEHLEKSLGLMRGTIRTICGGRTSVFSALKQAEAWLKSGPRACIVGGVDSLLDPADLRAFSARGVLAEEYDGFFPGEAAAFICLNRRSTIGGLGRNPAAVLGFGEAIEAADGSGAAPLVGVGMSAAMRRALDDAQVPEGAVGLCINAVNGTRSEFEDEAYARIRLLRTPRAELSTWHLASYLGETGAAYGALALLWASAALELGVSSAPGVLLSAAEGSSRAAVFMKREASGTTLVTRQAPAAGVLEPTFHTLAPISSTRAIEDDPGIRLGEIDDRHLRLAEQDFDQLASLIVVREGHFRSNSPWTDIEDFERRALAHLDALAWAGDTARELVGTYMHGEPEDAAAATFLLCCSSPRGGEIEFLLEGCAQSDEHRARMVTSAALCPPNVAESFLRRLAESEGPSAPDGLRGLTIARWLAPEWLDRAVRRLQEPTPEMIVALGAMTLSNYGSWATGWLMSLGGPLPLEATLAAMVLEPTQSWLRKFRTEELLEFAPEALALACLHAGSSVWSALERDPTPTRGAMIALGWSGETEGTPLLLAGLEADDDVVAEEAAGALARVYGLQPMETVSLVDEEASDGPRPAGPPASGEVDRLSRSRAQWEDALKGTPVSPQQRLRSGQPWGKRSALGMLLNPRTPCNERMIAGWEHAVLNRQPLAVHPTQWVSAQRRVLSALDSDAPKP